MIRTVLRLLATAALASACVAAAWAATEPPAAGSARWTIVLCAPGFPGDTRQAQPTMDAFARAAAGAAGMTAGSLGAVYHEAEQPGVDRLKQDDAVAALVPLPFFLKHAAALKLAPRLMVEREGGATERWSLVTSRGRVPSPASLAGWTIVGQAGYAPAFVRGPVLGEWGRVPDSATISFSAGVLPALRRALAGEQVAVLLDGKGAAALPSLPGADSLEVVFASPALPASVFALAGNRLPPRDAEALVSALLKLATTGDGREALAAMQVTAFRQADLEAIGRAARAYAAASAPAGR
jgi:hypothetical protein